MYDFEHSAILYDFFGFLILAITRCLELTTDNLLTRTYSCNHKYSCLSHLNTPSRKTQ